MRVLRGIDRRVRRPLCLALGVFDGVHLGHQRVIAAAVCAAASRGIAPAVLTFDPHPGAVVSAGGAPPLLTTTFEKLALLRSLGVHLTIVAHFDRGLADMPAERFLTDIIAERLRARCVVVGEGWRFGAGGAGALPVLRRLAGPLGFCVEEVPGVHADGHRVSSTRIRAFVGRGDIEQANGLLGRRYALSGPVVAGHGIGRDLGFPTANLDLPAGKLLPADGIYACWAGRRRLAPAVAYVGARPTFDGRDRRFEVHLLERPPAELEGKLLRVELVARLRGDRRFPSAAALVRQMERDCAEALAVLDRPSGS